MRVKWHCLVTEESEVTLLDLFTLSCCDCREWSGWRRGQERKWWQRWLLDDTRRLSIRCHPQVRCFFFLFFSRNANGKLKMKFLFPSIQHISCVFGFWAVYIMCCFWQSVLLVLVKELKVRGVNGGLKIEKLHVKFWGVQLYQFCQSKQESKTETCATHLPVRSLGRGLQTIRGCGWKLKSQKRRCQALQHCAYPWAPHLSQSKGEGSTANAMAEGWKK